MTQRNENQDEFYMQRALELAALGKGYVSPNPMVGCVIVHEDQIIGEGWHQRYGEAHAEVNAVNSLVDKSRLQASTVYVTLEPCAHHGKTPPCADMLAAHKVKRVVIGAVDTNPLVGGKGIERLQKEGVEVVTGVLEKESREINKRFFTAIENQRPYVILKWAQTQDGFVARKNYDSKWISNEQSRQMVHQWRAEEDAILVGSNTAQYDDPQLNVRGVKGKDPLRVLIDRKLSLNGNLKLFRGPQQTLVYNLIESKEGDHVTYIKLGESNFIEELLQDLGKRKIQSVVVEGGSAIHKAFIEANLWDEARIFTAPTTFGEGIEAQLIEGTKIKELSVAGDQLEIYLRG
jgi:diaminohydroxyphosphoribosylaminopyrimidine deaminase/5-amino-6-(5-phosphoribosylamino)uracil reductase